MRDNEEQSDADRCERPRSHVCPWPTFDRLPKPSWRPAGRVLDVDERVLLAVVDLAIRREEKLNNADLMERTGLPRNRAIKARMALVADGVITAIGGRGPGAVFVFGWGSKASQGRTLSESESVPGQDALPSESVLKGTPIQDALGPESVPGQDGTPSYQEEEEEEKKGSRAQTRAPAPAPARTHARDGLASLTADAETVRAALAAAYRKHRGASPPRELALGTAHHQLVIDIAQQCRDDAQERGTTVADEIDRRAVRWAGTRWRNGDWPPLRDLASNPANYLNDAAPGSSSSGAPTVARGALREPPTRGGPVDQPRKV